MKPRLFAKGDRRTLERLKNLRKKAQSDHAARVAQRILGVMLSCERHSVGEIARLLHMQRSTVHSWIKAFNEYGDKALLEGHRSGRPNRLTDQDLEKLVDIVDSGPVAYGLNTGVWTSPIVAHVINDEFNVLYHPGHVRKLLKSLGFSIQRPTTELVRADKKMQNRWIRYTYPNLKKKLKKKTRR